MRRLLIEDELDFGVGADEIGVDRSKLIRTAISEFSAASGQMGPGEEHATAEADLAAEFAEDEAELQLPSVTKLDLSKLSSDAPVRMSDLLEQWCFYWVTFPVSLWTRPGRGYNQLQFKADFNPGDDETTRPRTHDALPTQEFADLIKTHGKLSVGVGGKLKFGIAGPAVDLTAAGLPVQAEASTHGDLLLDAGVVLGPLDYTLQVPKVQRSNLELDHVRWRLEGARMVQTKDPGLRVILKVPVGTSQLKVHAAMRARRYLSTFDGKFVDALVKLPEKVAYFFNRGAPMGDMREWDLSRSL